MDVASRTAMHLLAYTCRIPGDRLVETENSGQQVTTTDNAACRTTKHSKHHEMAALDGSTFSNAAVHTRVTQQRAKLARERSHCVDLDGDEHTSNMVDRKTEASGKKHSQWHGIISVADVHVVQS